MKDLIEALTIFMKYSLKKDAHNPTHCEHDELMVVGIDTQNITEEDDKRLNELGFHRSSEEESCWVSFRFGSA